MSVENLKDSGSLVKHTNAFQLYRKRSRRRANLYLWLKLNMSGSSRAINSDCTQPAAATAVPVQRLPRCSIICLFKRLLLVVPIVLLILLYFEGLLPLRMPTYSHQPKPKFDALKYRLNTTNIGGTKWENVSNCTTGPYRSSFLGEDVTGMLLKGRGNFRIYKRGHHIFIPNFVKASRSFQCNESITFSTHGEFNFMDNLVPVVERWRGPVSIAVYAPGNDFSEALKRISYLRSCTSKLIKELVTFHMYIPAKFIQQTKIVPWDRSEANCSHEPPTFFEYGPSFRNKRNLTYPVNAVRNLARTQATTHYVLAADIELYPSPNLIPMLLRMVKRRQARSKPMIKSANASSNNNTPKVYVPPVFEVDEALPPPNSKLELLHLLKAKKAVPFHIELCSYCHKLPGYNKWLAAKVTPGQVRPSHWTTRKNRFDWEPVFIGTNADPLYHEELTWEGTRNKMSQAYEMCMRDYRYAVLDNAFLVHRPGIKKIGRNKQFREEIVRQNYRLLKIRDKLRKIHGKKPECLI